VAFLFSKIKTAVSTANTVLLNSALKNKTFTTVQKRNGQMSCLPFSVGLRQQQTQQSQQLQPR